MKRAIGLAYGKISLDQKVTAQMKANNQSYQKPTLYVHSQGYYNRIGLQRIQYFRNKIPFRQPVRKVRYVSDDDISNYTKIIVVRNPFSRILSAYKDKVLHARGSYKGLERNIKSKFRSINSSTAGISTFSEFIKWLIQRPDPPALFDGHFGKYYHICSPCDIQYDIILKQETLHDDASYLFNIVINSSLNVNQLLDPHAGPHDKKTSDKTTLKTMSDYYDSIGMIDRKNLHRYLLPDLKLFGYNVSFPVT